VHCRAPCCLSRSFWHRAGLGRRVQAYLGGDGEGEVSSAAAVHGHVCLLHTTTLLAHLEAKEFLVGQETRPSPSARARVNTSSLSQPGGRAEQGSPALTRSCSTKAISFFCRASTRAVSMASGSYCAWQLEQTQLGSTDPS